MTDEPLGALRTRRMLEGAAARTRLEPPSLIQRIAALPADRRAAVLSQFGAGDVAEASKDWRLYSRPTQRGPDDPYWSIWLILAGRGWGKTRTGGEWVRDRVERGIAKSIGLFGATIGDVWKDMVFGTEDAPGLVKLFEYLPPSLHPEVKRADRQIFFHTGAVARIYTAEEPEVRGPNLDTAWADELAKWRYLKTIWDNIEMTLRIRGKTRPRVVITTTPRPLQLIKDLLDDPDVRVTWGSTFANLANLDPAFVRRMLRRFHGTRQGMQELYGAVLDDNPDALFHASVIDGSRVDAAPPLARVVVAVDPAISENKRSDLTGIVVVGIGFDGQIYVLADLTGVDFDKLRPGLVYTRPEEPRKHDPNEWGDLVVRAYDFFKADALVVEDDRGGSLVESNVRAAVYRKSHSDIAAKAIRVRRVHARKTGSKAVRAEPVANLYEQGNVHHVGLLDALETEQTEWNPKLTPVSPNRIDALVHGITDLAGLIEEAKPKPDEYKGRPPRAPDPRALGSRAGIRDTATDYDDEVDDDD